MKTAARRAAFVFVLLLMASLSPAYATTYYVGKSGNDANSCGTASTGNSYNSANAKLTIASALTCYAAGDTVFVWRGTYYERLTLPISGTAGSRVNILGERGPVGEWLTIIDGSDAFTDTWSLATDHGLTGTGTYRAIKPTWTGPITGLSNDPCAMIADGVYIPHINWDLLDGGLSSSPDYVVKTGFEWLALSSGSALWNGVEAMFGNFGSVIYVRFRNGDNPNSKTIRVAPWSPRCDLRYNDFADFILNAKNYITIKDFQLQGANVGVAVINGATGNTIDSNKIIASGLQIHINSGAFATTVTNNLLIGNRIGLSSGRGMTFSYYDPPLSAARVIARNIYDHNKYVIDRNESPNSVGIDLNNSRSITATGNTMHDVSNGFELINFTGSDAILSGNTINNTFGSCITFQEIDGQVYFANNLLYECGNIPVRHLAAELSPPSLNFYMYKNRLYNPTENGGLGQWYQVSMNTPTVVTSHFYIYHNTVIGGHHGLMREGVNGAGIPFMLFFNNLIQLTNNNAAYKVYWDGDTGTDFCNNAARLAAWAFNWSFGQHDGCAWVLGNNIFGSAKLFNDTVLPPVWLPPNGSAPRGAAIRCDIPFVINGTNYQPLPECPTADWDIGAAQAGDAAPPGTAWLATDNFDNASAGVDLSGRSADSGATTTWQKDPYNENPVDAACTTENAPAGMSGKSMHCLTGANPANYYLNFTPISAGQVQFKIRPTANNPDGENLFSLFGPTVATWVTGIRLDSDGHLKLIGTNDTPGTNVDLGAYAANTTYCGQIQFDAGSHPNQVRASIDGGTFSAWTNAFGTFATVGSLSIQRVATNATIDVDALGPALDCTPVGSVIVTSPLAGSLQQSGRSTAVQWSTTNISSGTVTSATYSFDNFVTSYHITTCEGVAYNASPCTFTPTWPVAASMLIKICIGSNCGTSPAFVATSPYFK